jgi:hypothetical protein
LKSSVGYHTNVWFLVIFLILFKHFYWKCWEKHFVFDNISVNYMKITKKKLTSWYATQFLFQKHAMTFLLYGKTSFESHENSYWFLKNSSRPLPFTIFYWKLIYFNNASIQKKQNFKVSLTASFRESKVRPKIISEKS